MIQNNSPKHLKVVCDKVSEKLKLVKKRPSEIIETQQLYYDEVLEIYREAFKNIITNSVTYSATLKKIKIAYENALSIRDNRIEQFIIQDRVFGLSVKKRERDEKIKNILKDNDDLKDQNLKLTLALSKLKKDLGKLKDASFSDYVSLMRERDARYTLYFENLGLQMKLKELDGSSYPVDDVYGDPVVLRIALDRCRYRGIICVQETHRSTDQTRPSIPGLTLVAEIPHPKHGSAIFVGPNIKVEGRYLLLVQRFKEQLTATQSELNKLTDEYAETVPRRKYDSLSAKCDDEVKATGKLKTDLQAIQDAHKRVLASKKSLEEELTEVKERCRELERAGTPRPQWELCADFIGGGRDRWWQLASGLSSRDILRVLLKELGPAAESEQLEHFDGLGMDPVIPLYLRYEGKVRNLRLSRREVSVIINDIWLGKLEHGQGMSMQDYVTKYFEDRYQQPSVRAEWAYNLCAGAEQMLDEPQVKLFWGVLHGHLSEDIYWGHRRQWQALRDQVYRHSKDKETITIEEFEKVIKAVFPLKSEVDIKNLMDVARKQLKLKINNNEVNLDKLFLENEEGFDRVDLARELFRQRQLAQDKYIREVLAELGGKHSVNKSVSVEQLKRAIAIVDPAIDHIRMERYVRWACASWATDSAHVLPLRAVAARLAAGDFERVGPRYRAANRRTYRH